MTPRQDEDDSATVERAGNRSLRRRVLRSLFGQNGMAILFTAMSIALTVMSLLSAVTAMELRSRGMTADAQIVDYRRTTSRIGIELSSPVVSFTTSDGRRVRMAISGPSHVRPPMGTRLTVLYDPRHPDRAVKASEGPDFASPTVYAALAAAFFGMRIRADRKGTWRRPRT